MFRSLLALSAAAALSTALVTAAQAGGHLAEEQRQQAMKTVGKSTKTIGDMLKGATAFDAAAANAALADMQAAVASYGDYFPEGSESATSEAAPAIWSDRAGFDKVLADFQADIDAAVAAGHQDQAGIQAAFGEVAGNCRTCHTTYRVKKN